MKFIFLRLRELTWEAAVVGSNLVIAHEETELFVVLP